MRLVLVVSFFVAALAGRNRLVEKRHQVKKRSPYRERKKVILLKILQTRLANVKEMFQSKTRNILIILQTNLFIKNGRSFADHHQILSK